MALFRCASSSDGAGATITVTYNSSFYNKTMTCSNGTKTYTKTTTSSGSTEFNVSDEGTWTITCNGVSRTVNVVLNYTTQMAITQTITINGAQEDYITFTDATGSKVCQFASGQTSASASITFVPGQSITFTSTVAKDPDNLSQNYSKSITLTDSTTSIKVMPDGALYWYGYNENVIGVRTAGFSSIAGGGIYDATFNTNNITMIAGGTSSSSSTVGIALYNGGTSTSGKTLHVCATTSTGGHIYQPTQKADWTSHLATHSAVAVGHTTYTTMGYYVVITVTSSPNTAVITAIYEE